MDVRYRETRKHATEEEAEVLDQDQQQQVIDELEQNYHDMVKTSKYVFTAIAGFASAACLVIGYVSEFYVPFLLAALSFMALIPCHGSKRWAWAVAACVEASALVSAFMNIKVTGPVMWIGLHSVYFLTVLFFFSSQKFFHSVPEKIQQLYKLKYGAKLA